MYKGRGEDEIDKSVVLIICGSSLDEWENIEQRVMFFIALFVHSFRNCLSSSPPPAQEEADKKMLINAQSLPLTRKLHF